MVLRTILLKPMKKNLLIYAKSLKTSIQLKYLADNNTHKCMIKINEEILTASVTTQFTAFKQRNMQHNSSVFCPSQHKSLLSSTMVTHKTQQEVDC